MEARGVSSEFILCAAVANTVVTVWGVIRGGQLWGGGYANVCLSAAPRPRYVRPGGVEPESDNHM